MDASTRLYKRLGEIPEDPNDPESLDDLVVCAFGAFERYYLCWKTRSGEYRQDDYGLPPALKDWLYPSDDTTRDFASLQVVFGRGEEYFASDKDGKLEYKEPEIKKPAPADDEEKFEKQARRRSRTVSFLRPLSETSVRSDSVMSETSTSKRSSSISSQRASRPPSLSYTNSRTNSDMSLPGDTLMERQISQSIIRPSYLSQWSNQGSRTIDTGQEQSPPTSVDERSEPSPKQKHAFVRSEPPVMTTTTWSPAQKTPAATTRPGQHNYQAQGNVIVNPLTCTCGCHSSSLPLQQPQWPKSTYANASTQTSPPPSPPRRSLRIDTQSYRQDPNYEAVPHDSYYEEADYEAPPVIMGLMSSYFNKPGYQLGDSLFSGYQPITWGATYEYQDTFGEEALR